MSGLLVVLALALPASSPPFFPESRFDTISGSSVHYRQWDVPLDEMNGSVLLVHGFAASTFSWRNNIKTLVTAGYRVVAVDLPPYGYSDRRLGMDQTPAGRAKLLWQMLDDIDMRSVIPCRPLTWNLVGHSMGGGVVAAMAVERPRRTAGLVLVDPAITEVGTPLQRALLRCRPFRALLGDWIRATLSNPKSFARILDNAYGRVADSTAVAGYLAPLRVPETAEAVIDGLVNSPKTESPDPRQITSPTLIVWGDDDNWISPASGTKLKQKIRDSELKIVHRGGHVPMETEPELFNSILLDFLARSAR